MYRCLFIFLTILTTAVSIYAQCSLTVTIRVTDHHDHDQVPYVSVYLKELNLSADTDSLGQSSWENLCPGPYHITISHVGCPSQTKFIELQKSEIIDFVIEHHDEILEQIEITDIDPNTQLGKHRSTLQRDQIFESSKSSITEMLQIIPGVSMIRTGSSIAKPIINGMVGHRLVMVNQGIPQESQQWGLDHAPEIEGSTADKISVIQGPAAVQYGMNALGGVVIVEPILLNTDPHLHGEINLSTQSNGRSIRTSTILRKKSPLGHLRVAGSYLVQGDMKSPSYYLTNTGQQTGSFDINLSREKNKWFGTTSYSFFSSQQGILRGAHINNLTDLELAIGRKKPLFTNDDFGYKIEAPRQTVTHHTVKIQNIFTLKNDDKLEVKSAIQANDRNEFDIRRSNRTTIPALSLLLFNTFNEVNWQKKALQKNFDAKISFQHKYLFNKNRPETGILPLIPDYSQHHFAMFGIVQWALPHDWHLESGLRGEYRSILAGVIRNSAVSIIKRQYSNAAISLGTRKKFQKITSYTDLSIVSRPPDISELYSNGLHQGVSGIEEGNPMLVSETMYRIGQTISGNLTEHSLINVGGHYSYINDYIYILPTGENRLTIRGAFPVYNYKSTDAALFNMNARWIFDKSDWQLLTQADYTYGQDLTNNKGLVRTPPFTSRLNLQYSFENKWGIREIKCGLESFYNARQNRIASEDDFLVTPEAYFLQHVWIRLRLHHKWRSDIDILLRVDNVWNTTYRDYLNRWRYFADDTGRNVSLSIKSNF